MKNELTAQTPFSAGDTVLQHFRLTSSLPPGVCGQPVWRAFNLESQREVTLEFVPRYLQYIPEALEELRQEISANKRLDPRSILPTKGFHVSAVHAATERGPVPAALIALDQVMEEKRRRGEVFDPGDLQHWLSQLIEALDHAHEDAHRPHGDLRLENLWLLPESGELVTVGFGTSRLIGDYALRLRKPLAVTAVEWISAHSPEHIRDADMPPTVRGDLFSLGVILFELLTGEKPFCSRTGPDLVREMDEAVDSDRVRPGKRRHQLGIHRPMPPVWDHTVTALLHPNPDFRPQSIDEVGQRLRHPDSLQTVNTNNLRPVSASAEEEVISPLAPYPMGETSRSNLYASEPELLEENPIAAAVARSQGPSRETRRLAKGGIFGRIFGVLLFLGLLAAGIWALRDRLPWLPEKLSLANASYEMNSDVVPSLPPQDPGELLPPVETGKVSESVDQEEFNSKQGAHPKVVAPPEIVDASPKFEQKPVESVKKDTTLLDPVISEIPKLAPRAIPEPSIDEGLPEIPKATIPEPQISSLPPMPEDLDDDLGELSLPKPSMTLRRELEQLRERELEPEIDPEIAVVNPVEMELDDDILKATPIPEVQAPEVRQAPAPAGSVEIKPAEVVTIERPRKAIPVARAEPVPVERESPDSVEPAVSQDPVSSAEFDAFYVETGQSERVGAVLDTDQEIAVPAVSKEMATKFADWLTKKDLEKGLIQPNERYRLPKGSEWSDRDTWVGEDPQTTLGNGLTLRKPFHLILE